MTKLPVPRVSVLMAVYNNAAFVREAVESVLRQSFSDFELVVVDDGSTDGSTKILQEMEALDDRIVLHRHTNRGLTRSLNVAMSLCRGDLIARMDGDDVCEGDRFREQVRFAGTHTRLVAFGSSATRIDPGGERTGTIEPPAEHAVIVKQLWRGFGGAIIHPSLLVRRGSLEAIGGYDEAFRTAQDLDLCLRLAASGPVANMPEPLIRYRVHAGSVSASRVEQQDRDVFGILSKLNARAEAAVPAREIGIARWYARGSAQARAREQGRYGDALRHAFAGASQQPRRWQSWARLAAAFLGPASPQGHRPEPA